MIGTVLAWSMWLTLVCGAEPEAAPALPMLQREDFSADHPETWPKTNPPLEAIPRDEFEKLWSSIQPLRERRPRVVLERAVYQAALVNHRLQGGTFTAVLHRPAAPAAWFRWTPFNLALGEVHWQDGPAIFGADGSGQHWLLADRERRELIATWSLLGRRIGRQTEFELEIPEALTSTVALRVPRGQELSCSDKSIPLEAGTPEGPWVTWRIDLGSRTRATVIVRATEEDTPKLPLLTYRKQLSAEVSEDDLRFQLALQTEVLHAPVREIELSLPKAVELYSVTYGTDTTLRWTRVSEEGNRVRIRVTLPDAVMGDLRPLRVDGLLLRRPNTPTVVPQVELIDAVFLGAQYTVSLLKPLQLTSLKLTGCRESAAVTPTAAGESYQFQQFLPDALLMLEIRRPTSQLSAQVLSAVTFLQEEWQQRTEIVWSTLTGSAFQVSIQIPRDWEVTDVDALTTTGVVDQINWDFVEDSDGGRHLNVEFLEAVTPNSPRIVRLLTRQRRAAESRRVAFPAPRPLDVAAAESILVLQGNGIYRVGLPTAPGVTAVAPAALLDSWRALPLWVTLMREEEPHPALWCQTEGFDLAAPFVLERELTPADIETSITATISGTHVEEVCELTVRPVTGRACDRVLAYINEAGGDWTWTTTAPVSGSLDARRLPVDQHGLWNLPTMGELWELQFSEGTVTEQRLRAVRRRELKSPARIGLIFTPQAQTLQSSIGVREAASALPLEWTSRGLQEEDDSVGQGIRERRWRYSRLSADLVGATASSIQQSTTMLCDGQLRSTLSLADAARDIHELRLELRGIIRPFTLTLPAGTEWISAQINGETIHADPLNHLRIPAMASDEPMVVEWVYRTFATGSSWSERRLIPWPTGFPEVVWTRFEWILHAAPHVHLDAACAGLRSAEPLQPVSWRRRLFGPLARRENSALFLPWKPEAWKELLATPARPGESSVAYADSLRPAGWKSQHFYGPTPPPELLVDVVNLDRIEILGWVMVVLCALAVVSLRASRLFKRDRIVVILLTAGCTFSFLWTGPWTDIFGGCIAGIMFGGLLPRGWWQSPRGSQRREPGVPGGSTQSFIITRPITLLMFCTLGWGLLTAAEVPHPARWTATIYVPIDADGRPSKRLPFVYLSSEVLKQLRSLARERIADAPAMLIAQADYRVAMGSEPRAGFSVTYRVLAPIGEATACDLLLPSVTLSGPQSCLVDGRPAAVSALPGKTGLRILIPADHAPVSAVNAIQFAPHEITLDFDHPWRRSSTGGSCELPLPQTALARAEISGLSPTSDVQFDGVLGGWERSLDLRQASVALGAADRLKLLWQERNSAETRPPRSMRVTTVENLDVTAAAIEVRCRSTVSANPQQEPVSKLSWDFPPETSFRSVQSRPAGRAEITTLKNKAVRVEVSFYEPVQDAVLEAQFVVRHAPQLGEFVWRGVTPAETPAIQWDRPQRLWAMSSVPEIRVQPQSVENSGLVPVAAESVRDLLAGLTTDRTPQALFQVGTDAPVAFRWTTVASRRRLLVWQQRGELTGSHLRWTVEADVECATQPPAYSHSFLVDRRLHIDDISVRERGAERRLRWTESRLSGSPQTRVTIWLTDPCLETQRITLTAHMPLSTTGPVTLPNVRCEDAELVGGRWELQSARDMRGAWQSVRGLKPLSSTDDRLDASQHWIFEQTDLEPRAVIRFQALRSPGLGHALYLLTPAESGQMRLRARWEMAASEMLTGLQVLVPQPWKLNQAPSIAGTKLDSQKETDRGVVVTLGEPSRTSTVVIELVMQAPRNDFTQRQVILPQLTHDPGFITWVAEAVPSNTAGLLDGLAVSTPSDVPEWVMNELQNTVNGTTGPWRTALSTDLPQEWPRSEIAAERQEPRIEGMEHSLWCWDAHRLSGTTRAWMDAAIPSLTIKVPDGLEPMGAEVDGQSAILATSKPGVWELSAGKGGGFREVKLYWQITRASDALGENAFMAAVPLLQGQVKSAPVLTVFPPPGREFLQNFRWNGNNWIDRGLQRLEVFSDHLALHPGDADAPVVAAQFRSVYETTAEKLGHSIADVARPGTARAERWSTVVTRMDQAAPLLVDRGAVRPSTVLDDLLLDHPDACYAIGVKAGNTDQAWLVPAGSVRWLSAFAMVLFGYPLLRRAVRAEWSPWLTTHSYFAAGLLGIVWWLCWSPSLAGFALAVAAAITWIRAYRGAAVSER